MEDLNTQKKDQNVDQDSKKQTSVNNKTLIAIGFTLGLLIAIWIWKSVEINNIKSKAESDYQGLKEKLIKDIVTSKEEQLKLLAKSYVWAVRTEMMKGNISQVNLYALDMIKDKNFLHIAIANDSGIIISSTNKKDEGKPFAFIGETVALNNNNTVVENSGDSILIVTSPIMGFNNRLGTLFIKYAVLLPYIK